MPVPTPTRPRRRSPPRARRGRERRAGASRWAWLGGESGQASVELVAAVPAVLAAALVAWQIALAGHTAWMGANAARVGARAQVVGRDARAAARSALPRYLRPGLRVEEADGAVRVRVQVPLLLPRWRSPVTVSAAASLGSGG